MKIALDKCNKNIKILVLFLGLISSSIFSIPSIADTYYYPELQVVPSASDTLRKQAVLEQRNRWKYHIPMTASGLFTLVSGLKAIGEDDSDDSNDISDAGLAAIFVGAGTLATSVGLSAIYSPYRADYVLVRKMPSKSKRQKLERERAAEIVLSQQAGLAKRLKYITATTNFVASAAVAGMTDNMSTAILAGISTLVALGPIIFEHPWVEVYDNHNEFKKRIYSPIAKTDVQWNIHRGKLAPSLAFQYIF